MIEQSVEPVLPQKTVWYGVGKALEGLGPKAWEQRVQKVIEESIIPASSPTWQKRLEQNKQAIAKTAGWVATAAEVGIVAGVTYGGYKGIRSLIEKRTLKMPQKHRIPVVHIETPSVSIPIHISHKPEAPDIFIKKRRHKENAGAHLGDMTFREKLKLWALRQVGESANMPVGLRVKALESEHILGHTIRRRIHPTHTPMSPPNIDRIHEIAEDTPRRVAEVVGRVRNQRLDRRLREHEANQLIKTQHMDALNAAAREHIAARHRTDVDRIQAIAEDTPNRVANVVSHVQDVRNARRLQEHDAHQAARMRRLDQQNAIARARIPEIRARRAYENWSASLGTSPVADVLRQAEVLVHNARDEVVRTFVARLRSMPHTTTLEQVEQSKVAAQLFSYILDRRPDLQKQFGVGSARDGAIAAKAADWVRKNLPGISYLS